MSNFYPDMQCDSIDQIDFAVLQSKGIKGVLFDIDNTLAKYSESEPNGAILWLLSDIQAKGMKVALISNNTRERATLFAKGLGIDMIYGAAKPLKRGFLKAASNMELSLEQIAVVGDQIFTDIYGGNRCGMYTILVSPIESKENLFFSVKRFFEKRILRNYKKNGGNKCR